MTSRVNAQSRHGKYRLANASPFNMGECWACGATNATPVGVPMAEKCASCGSALAPVHSHINALDFVPTIKGEQGDSSEDNLSKRARRKRGLANYRMARTMEGTGERAHSNGIKKAQDRKRRHTHKHQ